MHNKHHTRCNSFSSSSQRRILVVLLSHNNPSYCTTAATIKTMTAEEFDLNIVAIPSQPNLNSTRHTKKKRNKYEKRRQHSQKAARRQKQRHDATTESPGETSSQDKDVEASANVVRRSTEPLPEQKRNETDKKAPGDSSKEISHENASDISQSSRKRPSPSAATPPTLSTPTDTRSPKKKPRRSLDDEEERAKYLAEFHARPMELDRRSGARSSTVVWSKDSSHLFGKDDGDTAAVNNRNAWSSLGIHPRLVQTVQSAQFNNLQRPTTIQSDRKSVV